MLLKELSLNELKQLKADVMNDFEYYKRKYADENDLDYDFEVTEDIFYDILEDFESSSMTNFLERFNLEAIFDIEYKSNGNYSLYIQGVDGDPESYVTL